MAVHEAAYFEVLLTVMVDPVKVTPFSKMSPVGVNHYGEDTNMKYSRERVNTYLKS